MVSLQPNQLYSHLRRNPLPNNFIHHITPKNKGKTATAGFSNRVWQAHSHVSFIWYFWYLSHGQEALIYYCWVIIFLLSIFRFLCTCASSLHQGCLLHLPLWRLPCDMKLGPMWMGRPLDEDLTRLISLLLMKSEKSATTSRSWWISLKGVGEISIFLKCFCGLFCFVPLLVNLWQFNTCKNYECFWMVMNYVGSLHHWIWLSRLWGAWRTLVMAKVGGIWLFWCKSMKCWWGDWPTEGNWVVEGSTKRSNCKKNIGSFLWFRRWFLVCCVQKFRV